MQQEKATIREATENDLEAIIALFADDPLGGHGDTTDPQALPDYRAAFRKIWPRTATSGAFCMCDSTLHAVTTLARHAH